MTLGKEYRGGILGFGGSRLLVAERLCQKGVVEALKGKVWLILLSASLLASACTTPPVTPKPPVVPPPQPGTVCVENVTARDYAVLRGLDGELFGVYDANVDDGLGCFTIYEKNFIDNVSLIYGEGLVGKSVFEDIVYDHPRVGPLINGALMMTYDGWKEDREYFIIANLPVPEFYSHGQLGVVDIEKFIGENGPSRSVPSEYTIFPNANRLDFILLPNWLPSPGEAVFLNLFYGLDCVVGVQPGDKQSSMDLSIFPTEEMVTLFVKNGFAGDLELKRVSVWDRQNGPLFYNDGHIYLVHRVHPDDRTLIDLPILTIGTIHITPYDSFDTSFVVSDFDSLGTVYKPGERIGAVQLSDPGRALLDLIISPGNVDEGGLIDIGFGPATRHDGRVYARNFDVFAWRHYPKGLRVAPSNIDRYSILTTFNIPRECYAKLP